MARMGFLRRLSAAALLFACGLAAQRPHPAKWTLEAEPAKVKPGEAVRFRLRVELTEPWHMYSPTTPKGGPIVTSLRLADSPVLEAVRLYSPKAERKFDPNFNIETETYDKEATFWFEAKVKPGAPQGPSEVTAQMRYQLCTDKECLPPKRVTAMATVTVDPAAGASSLPALPAGWAEVAAAETASPAGPAAAPVPSAGAAQGGAQSLGSFLLVAFGFGLAAIFTPCVFPMIPITMSFFLNQQGGNRTSILSQAVVFCLGIVVLFTGIGLGLSAALGPFAVVQLGSNPWVNGLITAVFFAFGLSLLGAFEITLPSGMLTKLNAASDRGGYAGVLIMGLTFSLASFACVGPFMGTLLAASVGGDKLQPALGMLAFSAALALPFFVLALFPGFLKNLPRSGGWMSRVKVVLGFLILAAMLKYLSNVDVVLGWNVLTRERFLALWVVLFALPGLYLLGLVRMEGIKADERVGPARALVATMFIGFALSLLPGMFGARLGEIEAYIPAPSEGAAVGMAASAGEARWAKNDMAGALARAKAENKLVLVAFTGYACTNCHWMKANMFTRPEVREALGELVLVELYTDGTDAASEANQKRQEQSFQTVAIPFYALVDGDEKVVASFAGLTKDAGQFLAFLKTRA